uniref:Adenylyl cyclase-associated protein n=1 Tax=Globodera rostochiensis TaxID=31243 RepID=A0A914ICI4_GLORO
MTTKELEGLVKRLEVTTQRLETLSAQKPGLAPKPPSANGLSAPQSTPPSVKGYDDQMEGPLKAFLEVSKKIGGDVATMADKVGELFDLHRQFLWASAGQPEPTDANALHKLLEPITHQLAECAAFKDSKKGSKSFNHLAAVAEGLQAVGWVSVKPTPGPFVKEMLDVAMFYVNRVRTENKTEPAQAQWATAWAAIFSALQAYIKQWHTTGVVWNSAPGAQPSNAQSGKSTPKKGGSPAPPPPPPPPADLFAPSSGGGGGGGGGSDRQALFNAINKAGVQITSGLKKVTSDMQTHKNPTLRGQTAVPALSPGKSAGGAGSKPKPGATTGGQPPKVELKDHKVWQIEFHKDNRDIKVQTDIKQSVYVYRCENSVVQIKGKVNSVTVDSCKKTSVVFDSLLSQVEVINSQSVEVQSLGALPTISIQKTDGCQVYLSKESLGAEIVTSKSSEMNVMVPKGDGDFTEFPVPEQFKTTFDAAGNKLKTELLDIA